MKSYIYLQLTNEQRYGTTMTKEKRRSLALYSDRKKNGPTEIDLHIMVSRRGETMKVGQRLKDFITSWSKTPHEPEARRLVAAWIERNRAALK